MSGGLDSSSVTSMAADVLGHRASTQLRAFTFAYDTLMEDEERRYSSATAASLGIPITRMPADGYAPFDRWDGGSHPAEPTLEGLTAVMSDMLELVSRHGGVVLTGDGGDSSLLPSTLFDQAGTMPFASLLADLWRACCARRPPPIGIRSWMARRWANGESIPGWLGHELLSAFDVRARWQEVRMRSQARGARGRAVSDVTDLWWTSTFEGLDPGATQRAVELRYPFFDVRLASFTLRLPSFPWCVNKHVLRTAMNGRLPDLVRTRPKTPLITSPLGPRGRWPTARALELFESTPEVARFVDVRKFRTMVKSDSLLSSETPAAWAAISLAMWLRGEVAAPAFDAR
jgi:asparagine synthase (glutamine-hydrolysing)